MVIPIPGILVNLLGVRDIKKGGVCEHPVLMKPEQAGYKPSAEGLL